MKGFVIAIAFAILLLTYRVPARAQKLEVLQYTAASIAVLEYDWYKDLPLPIWYCHSCFDDQSRYSQLGLFLRYDSNQPRPRHLGANSIKEEASPEFVYRVRLRNEGEKTIRAVDWAYIFMDRQTNAEVARHQFSSEEKVKPGKRTTLVAPVAENARRE